MIGRRVVGKVDPDRCYREAEDCQREATKMKEASDREFWRRLAAEWTKLAETVAGGRS
jgi:hypothetical protein